MMLSQHFKVMLAENRRAATSFKDVVGGYLLHIWRLKHHNMQNVKQYLHLSSGIFPLLVMLQRIDANWIFLG